MQVLHRFTSPVCLLVLLALLASARPLLAQDQPEDLHNEVDVAGEDEADEADEADDADDADDDIDLILLPNVAVNPEVGFGLGPKLKVKNLLGGREEIDVDAFVSTARVISLGGFVRAMNVHGSPFGGVIEAEYDRDPAREFFGLGNDSAGPEVASFHRIQRTWITLAAFWQLPDPDKDFFIGLAWSYVDTRLGDPRGEDRSTLELFPELPGLDGQRTSRITVSARYNTRPNDVFPTTGWNVVAAVSCADPAFLSERTFNRFVLDVGRTFDIYEGIHVVGVRGRLEAVEGGSREVPFYELAALGGATTLRGYHPYRFLGRGSAGFNAEYRVQVADREFFDLMHAQVRLVAFADVGRVFESWVDAREHALEHYRVSYGPGFEFILERSLVANVDIGFSEEETGLLYLSFGRSF